VNSFFKISLLLLSLGLVPHTHAQLSLSADYAYLKADEWDEVIRVYNFSRPWQENDLPFLTSGYSARIGWYFPVKKRQSLFIHPEAGWTRWRAYADNAGSQILLRIDAFSIQANINFNPRALFHDVSAGPLGTRWLMQISPGVQLWSGYLEHGGKVWLTDEETSEEYRPKSVSFFATAGVGYRAWMIAGQWVVTPRIGVRYSPRSDLEDLPEAVIGTNPFGLSSESRHVFVVTGGLEFTWIFPAKS